MEENIKTLQKVHLALVTGVAAFCVVTVFLNRSAGAFLTGESSIFSILYIVSIAVATVAVISSFLIFRNKVTRLKKITEANAKFSQLRAVWLIRIALIEAPALFGIIVFLLTGNYYLFILIGILLVIMISIRPGMEGMKKYLEQEEKS